MSLISGMAFAEPEELQKLIRTEAIWAASPTTARGQPTPLSSDPKGERIAYAVRRC